MTTETKSKETIAALKAELKEVREQARQAWDAYYDITSRDRQTMQDFKRVLLTILER